MQDEIKGIALTRASLMAELELLRAATAPGKSADLLHLLEHLIDYIDPPKVTEPEAATE